MKRPPEQAVVGLLRNPESARFGADMRVTKQGSVVEVCGTVSNRSGFGGYGQPEPFYASLTDGKVTEAEVGLVSTRGSAVHTSAQWHCI